MLFERRFGAPSTRLRAWDAGAAGKNPKMVRKTVRTGKIAPYGAALLALLATQHHNLHMLLLAAGIGGAGASLMTVVPVVRRIMLIVSLAMVGLIAYRLRDARRPRSMRIVDAVSVLVTIGLVGWSVSRFGW